MTMTAAERFAQGFAALNKNNLEQLAELYHDDMVFTDPLHTIQGLAAMRDYCANLYANVRHIDFTVSANKSAPVTRSISIPH